MKEITDNPGFIKFKHFTLLKTLSREWEDKSQTRRKYLQKTHKGLLFKAHKEDLKLNDKKMNNLILKWAKVLNRHLIKNEIQMVNKHMKRCSISYMIRELQIKTTERYHYIPIRMVKICNTDNTKCCQRCEATGTLIHCWWMSSIHQLWYSCFRRQFGSLL